MSGGGSSFYSADPAAVRAGGRALAEVASTVAGARRYDAIAGLGEAQVVDDGAAVFRDAWAGQLTGWQQSLSSLGAATSESATAMEGTDAELHAAWRASIFGPNTSGGAW